MIDVKQDVRLSFLQWLTTVEASRQDNYRVYREYYDGDHDTQLTDRMRRYLQVKSSTDFRANYCPIVVDALAERLSVTGFETDVDGDDQDEVFWDWWARNRMDGVQGTVHTSAVRDGDAYILVSWDVTRGIPLFTYEPAYDGHDGMKVLYDEASNTVKLASKRWRITSGEGSGYVRRMNVYFPNRIEKYLSSDLVFEGAWQPYQEEGEPWPIPWTRTGTEGGEPLGVPVIHFRNRDQGLNYGTSEIKDIIPIQDALNKTVIDLVAAADTTAFRIYWMLGDDPSGIEMAPGSWVYSTRPSSGENSAQVGYFPGEDLGNLIALKDSFAIEIARISRTPVSYFQVSGQRPAEGTLRQEEAGLVGKAKERQVTFGNSWEDAMMLARRLWNVYGSGPELDEAVQIATLWRDPQTRNEKELMEQLKVKAELGVPTEQLWAEMGYNASEIESMEEMRDADRQSEGNIGAALLRAYEQAGREPNQGRQQIPPMSESTDEDVEVASA